MEILKSEEYKTWVAEIKEKISNSQMQASLSVNIEMLKLYWDIGKSISEKLVGSDWGAKVVENISFELKKSFPDLDGFSKRNLMLMRQWVEFYQKAENEYIEIVKQAVSQFNENQNKEENIRSLMCLIPWGHNILIVQKLTSVEQAIFYAVKTLQNNWSRAVLGIQIENQLFERQGKAITNFEFTLPKPQSELAKETLKDPYKFDFLNLTENATERDIENQLIAHITNFLLELGTGFAFIARQYALQVGENEYKIDLLFYHIHLRCFIVIELKAVEFKPEFTGKLNFYLSAVDDLLCKENDNPTIGILLCKSKDKVEAEYALRGISQPIGVAEYEFCKAIPENLKAQLPTIQDLENELNN